MYRIPVNLADYLIKNSRDPEIPGLNKDPINPFTPRNLCAVGYLDPFVSSGADYTYSVFADLPYPETEKFPAYTPELQGYWLCKREELTQSKDTDQITVNKGIVDPTCIDKDEIIDITDCCIADVPAVDRLTCPMVNSLDRLLELEPGLKQCLTTYMERIK